MVAFTYTLEMGRITFREPVPAGVSVTVMYGASLVKTNCLQANNRHQRRSEYKKLKKYGFCTVCKGRGELDTLTTVDESNLHTHHRNGPYKCPACNGTGVKS